MNELELEFHVDTALAPEQTQQVSTRLIAANAILALSSQELQRRIDDEIDGNPALEREEVAVCTVCGSELHGSICPVCIQRQKGGEIARDQEEWFDREYVAGGAFSPDDLDPWLRVAVEQSLAEYLLDELSAQLSPDDVPIAEALVGSLDERGYLTWSVRDVANELGVQEAQVLAVLEVLQTLEPVGVGARSLRECLLIQLRYLEERGLSVPHAEDVVSDFLPELGLRQYPRIARSLGIRVADVTRVAELLKTKLNPHPALGFSETTARDRDTRAMYVIPDVIIHRNDDGYEVEVVESRRASLRINPLYAELTQLPKSSQDLSATELTQVKKSVQRATLFMAFVGQRRYTLHRVTTAIVEAQREFLEQGIRALRPLNRSDIAAMLGVHESTVSRATMGKHVMLPDGSVIPFAHFFKASLSIKDVMKEIIERASTTLTDTQIMAELAKRDIQIARRTVSKYRAQLDILSSRLR